MGEVNMKVAVCCLGEHFSFVDEIIKFIKHNPILSFCDVNLVKYHQLNNTGIVVFLENPRLVCGMLITLIDQIIEEYPHINIISFYHCPDCSNYFKEFSPIIIRTLTELEKQLILLDSTLTPN